MLRKKFCHKRDNSTAMESFCFFHFYSVDVAFIHNMGENRAVYKYL